MKKYITCLSFMLFTLACNNSEEKQSSTRTENYVPNTTVPSLPKPKKLECSKVLQNREIHGVAIYFDNFETGTGGVYKDNGKWYLITVSHVFPTGRVAYYSTVINNDTFYVAKTIINRDDGVIMELSKTKNKFAGFSSHKNDGSQKAGWTMDMLFGKVGGQKIFSLCGTLYAHIGYLVDEPDFMYAGLIINKYSLPGESGTIFYDEKEHVYVLSQLYPADDNEGYRINGIKKNQVLTLLRPIGFGITISKTGVKTSVPW